MSTKTDNSHLELERRSPSHTQYKNNIKNVCSNFNSTYMYVLIVIGNVPFLAMLHFPNFNFSFSFSLQLAMFCFIPQMKQFEPGSHAYGKHGLCCKYDACCKPNDLPFFSLGITLLYFSEDTFGARSYAQRRHGSFSFLSFPKSTSLEFLAIFCVISQKKHLRLGRQ